MEEIKIVLMPVKYYERKDAEGIEDKVIRTLKGLDEDVEVYSLSDFMDKCNDEEINLDAYWVSYIKARW